MIFLYFPSPPQFFFFFFNDTATTEIYTLSLHDALPILARVDFLMEAASGSLFINEINTIPGFTSISIDRKRTRLNSSHDQISYAVFCLKKKHQLAGRDLLRIQLPTDLNYYRPYPLYQLI